MISKLRIIANKLAGNGAGADALDKVSDILKKRGIPFEVSVTERPGHAKDLSAEAWERGERELVSLGGDGTISEVVNGLAGRPATLLFVPCGTGNDFVRMMNLPKDPLEAFTAQLDGTPHPIDSCQVNDRYFLNVSGSGLDVEVLRQAERFKKLGKGLVPYLMGVVAAVRRFKPLTVQIVADGKTETRKVTIFTVGNGAYYGGGMKAAPHARIDDGLFEFLIVDEVKRTSILPLLGKFIAGKHTELPFVHETRCSEIHLRCPGMTLNLDGELVDSDEARYRILPGALQVMMPKEGSAENGGGR